MRDRRATHLACYALLRCGDMVALIRKGRGPFRGMWDLPGGRIEFGEGPAEALRREIAEETGLEADEPRLVTVLDNVVHHQLPDGSPEELHHIGIIYRVVATAPDHLKEESDGEDSLGARWFTTSEAAELELTPFARRVMELAHLHDPSSIDIALPSSRRREDQPRD